MTKSVKKTTTAAKAAAVEPTNEKIEKATENQEEKVETVKTPEKKVFKADDLIDCKSLAPGGTFVKGPKTGALYTFEYEGAITPIEYQDLMRMVNQKSTYLFRPFIIVLDDDFVNEFPRLKDFYDAEYSLDNLEDILDLPAEKIEEAIGKLPIGAKDAVKGIAVTKISDGSYDPTVAQVKALDNALGTQIMLIANL